MSIKISLKNIKSDLLKKEKILKQIHNNCSHLIHSSARQLCIYFEIEKLEELEEIKIQKYQTQIDLHKICTCTDSHHTIKDLYASEKSAIKQVDISNKKLIVYPCPTTFGWHLSKG